MVLNDKQLLEMLNHELPDKAFEHFAACASCAERLQALQESWDLLGQWTIDVPDVDLTDRILSHVQCIRPIYLWQTQTLIRVAASILIGVGVGGWLGRSGGQPVSDQQVVESMYLDVLTLSSSTGWATPLLEDGQE